MKVSTCIAGAIDAIERFNWIQGTNGSQHIGFCTAGALDFAAGWQNPAVGAYDPIAYGAARHMVAATVDVPNGSWVSSWNDRLTTNKAEVLSVLRLTLERARKMEQVAVEAA